MRTRARYAGTLAAVAATALLMTGCGGGGDDGDDEKSPPPTASSGPSSPDEGGEGEGDAVTLDDLQGGWTTKLSEAEGGLVVIGVEEDQVAVSADIACQGDIDDGAQPLTIRLTCGHGAEERRTGTVESLEGDRLTIAWESGQKDVLTRTPDLEDLPGVPSELPTDLPEMPPTDR